MDSTQFFGSDPAPGLEDDKDGHGRYLLDADGHGKKPYTRTTTIAKMLDDTSGLSIWQQRKAAKGVAQSPALVARAAVTPLDDKPAWREILAQADVKSGGDEKRELGSAFHALHEHVETMTDDEWSAVPDDLRATYVKYRAELDRLGIIEIMTEVTVVNTKIGVAGKVDAIFQLADGRLVIGDRKSGRITEYPHSAAVQLAIYANSDVLITWGPDGATIRHAMPELDVTTAIVIDVKIGDENTASVHVYEIDTWAGWSAALLSAKIRRWRNRKDLITPYHPEFPPADRARNAAAVEKARVIEHQEQMTTLVPGTGVPPGYVAGSADTPPPATPEQRASFAAELPSPSTGFPTEVAHGPTANANSAMSATAKAVLGTGPAIGTQGADAIQPPHAGTHPAWSSKDQAVVHLDSKGERVPEPTTTPQEAPFADRPSDLADASALLEAFKTKAALQAVLSKVDPTANLARQRKNLALAIVHHPTWPARRAEFLAMDEGEPDGRAAPSTENTTFSPVVSNAPGPVPPDPEPSFPAQQPAPVADNPFAQPAAAPTESTEDTCLRMIGEATTMDALAAVWNYANDNGIGWPPRLHSAATIRQKQLTTAPAAQ